MGSPSNDLYEFGPCHLDAGQRVLMREDHRVPLAPKAFDLLLLLVRSPGRAFSKQELMTALWPDTFVEEANLSFQISTLRKALGDGASEWIETVPKHGYRFAADVVTTPFAPQMTAASPAEIAPVPAVPVPARSRKVWRLTAGFIVGLMIIAGGYLILVRPRPTQPLEPSNVIATPLTAYPGDETGPSLSPDGNQVAFSWSGPPEDNHDVYIKRRVGRACPADEGTRTRRKPGVGARRTADCVRTAHRAHGRGLRDASPGGSGTASGVVRP